MYMHICVAIFEVESKELELELDICMNIHMNICTCRYIHVHVNTHVYECAYIHANWHMYNYLSPPLATDRQGGSGNRRWRAVFWFCGLLSRVCLSSAPRSKHSPFSRWHFLGRTLTRAAGRQRHRLQRARDRGAGACLYIWQYIHTLFSLPFLLPCPSVGWLLSVL